MTALFAAGTKHTCAGCANRFYDLAKSPAICPLCQTTVVVGTRKSGGRAKRRTPDTRIDHEHDAAQAQPKHKRAVSG